MYVGAPAHIVWPDLVLQFKQWVCVNCISLYIFTFLLVVNYVFPHFLVDINFLCV